MIGAGPSGSECAWRLARAGYEVLVVEEHLRAGEPVHCTGVISAQAYAAFDLPRSAIQGELIAAELTSPGGIVLHVPLNGSRAYTVDRREVDLALAQRANEAGARFCYDTRVRGLAVDRAGVTVTGAHSGQPWRERARAVVLATGARSGLPRQVGLASAREHAHGAQAEVPVASPATMRVWLGHRLAPGGFGWVVPGKPGWSRVGVLTAERPRAALRKVARRAFNGTGDRLSEADGSKLLSDGSGFCPTDGEITVHPIPSTPRHPTCGDRVLSVGDAAGQVKMTTGGGVYYGLLAAQLASEVLAEGLARGRLGTSHLARYERLWQEVLGPEQRAGQLLRRLVSAAADETLDEIFRGAERRGLSRYLLELVDFDWHARPAVGLMLAMLGAAPEGRGLKWLGKLLR